MVPSEADIDQDWRSIIRDGCELNDLRSFGDEVKRNSYRLLEQVAPPQRLSALGDRLAVRESRGQTETP